MDGHGPWMSRFSVDVTSISNGESLLEFVSSLHGKWHWSAIGNLGCAIFGPQSDSHTRRVLQTTLSKCGVNGLVISMWRLLSSGRKVLKVKMTDGNDGETLSGRFQFSTQSRFPRRFALVSFFTAFGARFI